MEFKTQFQQTVVDFITNKLTVNNPVICVSSTGKSTALAFAALDVQSNVVVLCSGGKRQACGFIDKVRSILNKRQQTYEFKDHYDGVKLANGKTVKTFPIGQETWDVHLDDDVEYVFFDDAHLLHPMVVKRLVEKMTNKKIAISSYYFISELRGVAKVKISN